MKVLETLRLENGFTVCVCERFEDKVITDTLRTDSGIIASGEFEVMRLRECFSAAKTRMIVIKKELPAVGISLVEFV